MSSSSGLSLNSHLGPRKVFEEVGASSRPSKKPRTEVLPNLVAKTVGLGCAKQMTDLPLDVMRIILLMAGNLTALKVNKVFASNSTVFNDLWIELESILRNPPEGPLERDPSLTNVQIRAQHLVGKYLREINPNLFGFERAKTLYQKMTEELSILDPEALVALNPKDRIVDPKLYLEIAQKIGEINDRSLELAWEEMLGGLVVSLAENDPNMVLPPLPPSNAYAEEIRIWLNFEGNQPIISTIEDLDLRNLDLPAIFPEIEKFTGLEELNLRGNKIKGIRPFTFSRLTVLNVICLSHNDLRQLPETLLSTCNRLTEIFFEENRLSLLPPLLFAGCPYLKSVDFRYNQLVAIPELLFNATPQLTHAFFTGNLISKLPSALLHGCEKLQQVVFFDNFIEVIPEGFFWDCTNLSEVNFSKNMIFKLDDNLFLNNHSLEFASFGDNLLTQIPSLLFVGCEILSEAYFCNNEIGPINEDLFPNCINLEQIDFSHNQVSSVSNSLCENCHYLEIAYFDGNPVVDKLDIGSQGHWNLRLARLIAKMSE